MSTVIKPRNPSAGLPEAAGTLRKKAASPVMTKRFSPYKLDFSLLQDGQPKIPSSDQFEEIMYLFPNRTSVKAMLSFLVVTCKTLPPRPWPLTVAGLPLYLTTENNEPLDLGLRMRGPKTRLDVEIRL